MTTRRFGLISLLGLIAIFLDSVLLQAFLPVVPNLLLLLAIYVALHEINHWGALLCFVLGLELDLYTGLVLGAWSGAFVCVFCGLVLLSQRIFIEAWLVEMLSVVLVSLLCSVAYVALLQAAAPAVGLAVTGGSAGSLGPSFGLIVKEALVTGIFAPPVFMLLRRFVPYRARHGSRRDDMALA